MVRFGEHLESHMQLEWREKYFQFSVLTTLLDALPPRTDPIQSLLVARRVYSFLNMVYPIKDRSCDDGGQHDGSTPHLVEPEEIQLFLQQQPHQQQFGPNFVISPHDNLPPQSPQMIQHPSIPPSTLPLDHHQPKVILQLPDHLDHTVNYHSSSANTHPATSHQHSSPTKHLITTPLQFHSPAILRDPSQPQITPKSQQLQANYALTPNANQDPKLSDLTLAEPDSASTPSSNCSNLIEVASSNQISIISSQRSIHDEGDTKRHHFGMNLTALAPVPESPFNSPDSSQIPADAMYVSSPSIVPGAHYHLEQLSPQIFSPQLSTVSNSIDTAQNQQINTSGFNPNLPVDPRLLSNSNSINLDLPSLPSPQKFDLAGPPIPLPPQSQSTHNPSLSQQPSGIRSQRSGSATVSVAGVVQSHQGSSSGQNDQSSASTLPTLGNLLQTTQSQPQSISTLPQTVAGVPAFTRGDRHDDMRLHQFELEKRAMLDTLNPEKQLIQMQQQQIVGPNSLNQFANIQQWSQNLRKRRSVAAHQFALLNNQDESSSQYLQQQQQQQASGALVLPTLQRHGTDVISAQPLMSPNDNTNQSVGANNNTSTQSSNPSSQSQPVPQKIIRPNKSSSRPECGLKGQPYQEGPDNAEVNKDHEITARLVDHLGKQSIPNITSDADCAISHKNKKHLRRQPLRMRQDGQVFSPTPQSQLQLQRSTPATTHSFSPTPTSSMASPTASYTNTTGPSISFSRSQDDRFIRFTDDTKDGRRAKKSALANHSQTKSQTRHASFLDTAEVIGYGGYESSSSDEESGSYKRPKALSLPPQKVEGLSSLTLHASSPTKQTGVRKSDEDSASSPTVHHGLYGKTGKTQYPDLKEQKLSQLLFADDDDESLSDFMHITLADGDDNGHLDLDNSHDERNYNYFSSPRDQQPHGVHINPPRAHLSLPHETPISPLSPNTTNKHGRYNQNDPSKVIGAVIRVPSDLPPGVNLMNEHGEPSNIHDNQHTHKQQFQHHHSHSSGNVDHDIPSFFDKKHAKQLSPSDQLLGSEDETQSQSMDYHQGSDCDTKSYNKSLTNVSAKTPQTSQTASLYTRKRSATLDTQCSWDTSDDSDSSDDLGDIIDTDFDQDDQLGTPANSSQDHQYQHERSMVRSPHRKSPRQKHKHKHAHRHGHYNQEKYNNGSTSNHVNSASSCPHQNVDQDGVCVSCNVYAHTQGLPLNNVPEGLSDLLHNGPYKSLHVEQFYKTDNTALHKTLHRTNYTSQILHQAWNIRDALTAQGNEKDKEEERVFREMERQLEYRNASHPSKYLQNNTNDDEITLNSREATQTHQQLNRMRSRTRSRHHRQSILTNNDKKDRIGQSNETKSALGSLQPEHDGLDHDDQVIRPHYSTHRIAQINVPPLQETGRYVSDSLLARLKNDPKLNSGNKLTESEDVDFMFEQFYGDSDDDITAASEDDLRQNERRGLLEKNGSRGVERDSNGVPLNGEWDLTNFAEEVFDEDYYNTHFISKLQKMGGIPPLKRKKGYYDLLIAQSQYLTRCNRKDLLPQIDITHSPAEVLLQLYPIELRSTERIEEEMAATPAFVSFLPNNCTKLALEKLFCNALQSQLDKINEFTLLLEQYYDAHLYLIASIIAQLEYTQLIIQRTCINGSLPPHTLTTFISHRNTQLDHVKKTLLELAHGIGYLENYQQLNLIAFAKVLKKHDKRSLSFAYSRHVLLPIIFSSHFAQSTAGSHMKYYVEILFTRAFGLEKAKKILHHSDSTRNPHSNGLANLSSAGAFQNDTTPSSMMRIGALVSGIVMLIIVNLLAFFFWPERTYDAPTFRISLPIFRVMIYMVTACWVWSVVAWACKRIRVNYQLILQLNPSNYLQPPQLFEISAIMSLIGLLTFTMYTLGGAYYFPGNNFQSIVAYVGFLVFITIFFLPVKIMSRTTRWYIIKRMLQFLTAPFSPATLDIVVVGNYISSMNRMFYDLSYGACIYSLNPKLQLTVEDYTYCNNFNHHYVWWILMVPAFFRAMHGVRSSYYTKDWYPYIVNTMKYSLQFPETVLSHLARNRGHDPLLVGLWAAVATLRALWSLWWDITMDWCFTSRIQAAVNRYENWLQNIKTQQHSFHLYTGVPYNNPNDNHNSINGPVTIIGGSDNGYNYIGIHGKSDVTSFHSTSNRISPTGIISQGPTVHIIGGDDIANMDMNRILTVQSPTDDQAVNMDSYLYHTTYANGLASPHNNSMTMDNHVITMKTSQSSSINPEITAQNNSNHYTPDIEMVNMSQQDEPSHPVQQQQKSQPVLIDQNSSISDPAEGLYDEFVLYMAKHNNLVNYKPPRLKRHYICCGRRIKPHYDRGLGLEELQRSQAQIHQNYPSLLLALWFWWYRLLIIPLKGLLAILYFPAVYFSVFYAFILTCIPCRSVYRHVRYNIKKHRLSPQEQSTLPPLESLTRSFWRQHRPTAYLYSPSPNFPAWFLPKQLSSLFFHHSVWFYLFVIVFNLIIRLLFIVQLQRKWTDALQMSNEWISFSITWLGVLRRGVWTYTRFESDSLKLSNRLQAINLEGEIAGFEHGRGRKKQAPALSPSPDLNSNTSVLVNKDGVAKVGGTGVAISRFFTTLFKGSSATKDTPPANPPIKRTDASHNNTRNNDILQQNQQSPSGQPALHSPATFDPEMNQMAHNALSTTHQDNQDKESTSYSTDSNPDSSTSSSSTADDGTHFSRAKKGLSPEQIAGGVLFHYGKTQSYHPSLDAAKELTRMVSKYDNTQRSSTLDRTGSVSRSRGYKGDSSGVSSRSTAPVSVSNTSNNLLSSSNNNNNKNNNNNNKTYSGSDNDNDHSDDQRIEIHHIIHPLNYTPGKRLLHQHQQYPNSLHNLTSLSPHVSDDDDTSLNMGHVVDLLSESIDNNDMSPTLTPSDPATAQPIPLSRQTLLSGGVTSIHNQTMLLGHPNERHVNGLPHNGGDDGDADELFERRLSNKNIEKNPHGDYSEPTSPPFLLHSLSNTIRSVNVINDMMDETKPITQHGTHEREVGFPITQSDKSKFTHLACNNSIRRPNSGEDDSVLLETRSPSPFNCTSEDISQELSFLPFKMANKSVTGNLQLSTRVSTAFPALENNNPGISSSGTFNNNNITTCNNNDNNTRNISDKNTCNVPIITKTRHFETIKPRGVTGHYQVSGSDDNDTSEMLELQPIVPDITMQKKKSTIDDTSESCSTFEAKLHIPGGITQPNSLLSLNKANKINDLLDHDDDDDDDDDYLSDEIDY